jgi:hypothetical protein
MASMQVSEYEGLPHIPGGVATAAVFALAVGIWLSVGQGTTSDSGPLRVVGVAIVVAAVAVLGEALGFFSLAATPW